SGGQKAARQSSPHQSPAEFQQTRDRQAPEPGRPQAAAQQPIRSIARPNCHVASFRPPVASQACPHPNGYRDARKKASRPAVTTDSEDLSQPVSRCDGSTRGDKYLCRIEVAMYKRIPIADNEVPTSPLQGSKE